MVFAGLVSVADWIASNEDHFPPVDGNDIDLSQYLTRATQQAQLATSALGWNRLPVAQSPATFTELFPKLQGGPNGMQSLCGQMVAAADKPFLLLVEAPMGQGKTEAALWAADLAQTCLGHGGLYYALPTQATSNQMFLRMREFLQHRYPSENVSFHLLHGLANLNESFAELRSKAAEAASNFRPSHVGHDDGAPGTLVAWEWFCARKRGLLAPFAVGTIDQALLAALTTRHMFVRLFGLAGKTVILDEVHAYDAYMSTLLKRLIEWLSALGANVVLLSATLPAEKRRDLVAAYAGNDAIAHSCGYPRVSWVSGSDVRCKPIPVTESKTVRVVPSSSGTNGALSLLAEKLQGGGCVAWICNTVGHAQDAFRALDGDSRFSDADRILFHARFMVEDRLRLEKTVLERFGKPKRDGANMRPRKAVVVATQVIEQSLDLDFDWILTELSPVDLMLQRIGRLHRHRRGERPAPLSTPELCWLEPESGAEGRPAFGPSAFIYEPYILLRTLRLLKRESSRQLMLPADVEAWIEAVYGKPEAETDSEYVKWRQEMEQHRPGFA
jgi:CRISPR-associated endonuclease/helicase Cas3